MSEIASAVERTRKAFAAVSRLEDAIAKSPEDRSLQVNLAAMRKLALQSQDSLLSFSQRQRVEVCNYRLLPEASGGYSLFYVSKSLFEYQNLFSQIHDALKNGKKKKIARISSEALAESALEFAYSYSGSLGVVLLAQSHRDFFEGTLDKSIDVLYSVIEINSSGAVRSVADEFGAAVVKRVHDWSDANVKGGFAADVRWNRSDGRQMGEVVERRKLEKIVGLIEATSEEKKQELRLDGILVGGDIQSGTFHFVVPNGDSYRGRLAQSFNRNITMTLGHRYRARINESVRTFYATEKQEKTYSLLGLQRSPAGAAGD